MQAGEILSAIRQAVALKREGAIDEALDFYQKLLLVNEKDWGSFDNAPPSVRYALAQVWRSMAKVSYIKRDFANASHQTVNAIIYFATLLSDIEMGNYGDLEILGPPAQVPGIVQQYMNHALVFLGFCSKTFRKSSEFEEYHESLRFSGPAPPSTERHVSEFFEYGKNLFAMIEGEGWTLPEELQ